MTYLEITQAATTKVVSLVVARQSREFIIEHADVDPDSIMLKVGTGLVGDLVAKKLSPHTDAAVEKTFAWVRSKRNKETTVAE